jgi:UDP-N-acetyl-D-mannosaminuronate dehydrogenase
MSLQGNSGDVILKDVLVIGLGEVGSALLEIVSGVYHTTGYDIKSPQPLPRNVDVLHICFPYSEKFVDQASSYIEETNPDLALIESTVLPGTTEKIHDKHLAVDLCHSPIRARAADGFKWGFYNYTKFIGPVNGHSGEKAEKYYQSLGFKTRVCRSPLETEYAKLINLAYFAIMLGWNQDMRRIAQTKCLNFADIATFLELNTTESGHRFPQPVYDGDIISGHCILPGVQLLQEKFKSNFLESVLKSNKQRKQE